MATAMIQLRDKLLEEVQKLKEQSEKNEHIKGYRDALNNIANDIDAQMLAIEREQINDAFVAEYAALKWISCSERLPEAKIEVLGYMPTYGVKVKPLYLFFHEGSKVNRFADYSFNHYGIGEVTHWMELPQPPKV